MIDARGAHSLEALIERERGLIARLKPPPGSIIRGRGLDQERFTGQNYPTRYDLDKISQEHGIFISRTCGGV